MKVSIIIPNYNGGEMLIKNLPRIVECGVDEIIIVDDASTEPISHAELVSASSSGGIPEINSGQALKQVQDDRLKIKILENKKNLGFSSTVNRGVQEAIGDIVVLLNTDVLPEKDFLKFLLPHFADPKVFAVGCMDKSVENGKIVLRGRGLGEWQRGFYLHRRGEVDKTDTDWVSCGSGAFRKEIWQELGGLDEAYNPFYWEDIDLSYRAKKKGYKIFFEPKSVVIHKHEEGAIKQKYSAVQIKAISYRNQFLFAWENMDRLDLWTSHLLWLPYHFIKALERRDLAFYLGFIYAFIKIGFWTSQNDGKAS